MREYCYLTAVELSDLIKAREVSVEEVIRSHLKHIEEIEDRVKAWTFLDKERVIQRAIELDEKLIGESAKGSLYGIPVGIKDIFNTYDMPTGMGSPQWEGFTPGNDARCVHYLRMNNAVFPGKTVTAEFAVHAPGKTLNPYNPEYSPGTSSSGSAAAVASFMVPLSIGTQTAGSIIRPASYCGVYGFKPSFGLIPRTGALKTADTLDTVGMFARSPQDLRLLFEVMRVWGENFPISNKILNDKLRQKKGQRPWRVAVIPELTKRFSKPYAYKAVTSLIEKLEEKNDVELVTADFPIDIEEAFEIHTTLYEKSLSYYFQREFSNTVFISKIIHGMISRGSAITVDEYTVAVEKQDLLYKRLDDFFSKYDLILTLSTQGIAPKMGDDDSFDTCFLWTLCGAPVINIPIGKGPQDMPFGVQIVGRRYNDYLLLRFSELLADYVGQRQNIFSGEEKINI
ncbi:MAG: amidase [Candidatus Omnitrophica bacterium]|nr:amidase [Candidatus Omnitrophota bacterium]